MAEDTLSFSEPKQLALLGHLLSNDLFFLQVKDRFKSEWFIESYAGRLFTIAYNFYLKYKRIPTISEIKEDPSLLKEDQGTRNAVYAKLALALHHIQNYQLDLIKDELTEWLHSRILTSAVKQSAKLYNEKKISDACQIIQKASSEIKDTTFEDSCEVVFDNYVNDFDKQVKEYANALTFGVDLLDRLLCPKASSGSLLKGDTTILLAPVNIGKTSSIITVARHNIFRNKKVLLLIHEGNPNDLKEKIWCSVLGITPVQLFELYKTKEGQAKLNAALTVIKKNLRFLSYQRAGMCVEDVEVLIRKEQEALMASTGSYFDLVCDDYPGLLSTKLAQKGNLQKRHIDDYVYRFLADLGAEYGSHNLFAVQSNREGSRENNKGTDEGRLLTIEDVSESWGIMMKATSVISINRDPTSEARGRVIYYICKSRSSERGWAVVCKSNYAHCLTHSNELGATAYRSNLNMAEKIESMLGQYNGQVIPSQVILDS